MSSAEDGDDISVRGDDGPVRNNPGGERGGGSPPIQEGSDEEFVPAAASSLPKRAKLAELSVVTDGLTGRMTTTNDADDECEQDADGCPICYEPWTSGGIHRVCSLRCGHLFGKQCIETWLTSGQRNKCPQCNAHATKNQIRVLFVKNLRAVDTSERDTLRRQLEEERISGKRLQEERLKIQLVYNLAMAEINQLRERIRSLEEQASNSTGSFSLDRIKFKRAVNFTAARTVNGEFVARCTALDEHSRMLVVGGGRSPTDSGVYKVSLLDEGRLEYYGLHENIIKALSCSPYSDGNLLSISFDKTLKLSSPHSHSTLLAYALPAPGWSCSFDPLDRNCLYAGLANGLVCKFDVRQTRGPLWQRSLPPDLTKSPSASLPLPIHSVVPISSDQAILGNLLGSTLVSTSAEEHLEVLRQWSLPGCCSVAAKGESYVASARGSKPLHLIGSLQPDLHTEWRIKGSCPQSSMFRSSIISDGMDKHFTALPDGPSAIICYGSLASNPSLDHPSLQTSLSTNSPSPVLDATIGQVNGNLLIALLSNHQLNIFSK